MVKNNQRINSSIYKDNIGIDDIIHNTYQKGTRKREPNYNNKYNAKLRLNQNSELKIDEQFSSQY